MVGSSKLKNLPHCSNLKVRHKAPKTTKYVPLRHSQPQRYIKNIFLGHINEKCKKLSSIRKKNAIFAVGQ